MTKQSPKIVFFGNERLATGVTTKCPAFRALLEAGYDIAALVLHSEPAVTRRTRAPEIASLAADNNIPVIQPAKLADIKSELKELDAQIGVVIAFGKIIPLDIIDIFPHGIINVHPSKLPKHRGPTPLESVILGGEKETAVSIMKLTQKMDAGPVYAQRTFSVPGNISKQELANCLSEIGSKMLVQHLPGVIAGTAPVLQQDEAHATYDSLLTKSSGQIDWTQPAEVIEKQIRAYHNWPKSTARLGNHQLIITDADVDNTPGKPGSYLATKKTLFVYCGSGALNIRRVQPVNKKEMPIEAFLAGHAL